MNPFKLIPLVAALSLSLACPKRADVNVAGSDDEQVDQITAQLEEIRSSSQSDTKCPDLCALAGRVDSFSATLCEISGRHPDRNDLQRKCVQSQEERARLNDGCAPCR
ncbi:MAG: hypothetical protein ACT4TC_23635 [Myxococcaceae bacterium]